MREKFYFTFCFVILLTSSVYAQEKIKDSLKEIWYNNKLSDSVRTNAIINYLSNHTFNDPNETIKISKELIELGKQNQDYNTLAKAYNYLSRGFFFSGDSQQSFNNLKTSIDFSIKAGDIESSLWHKINLAVFFKESHLTSQESLDILEEVENIASHYELWDLVVDSKYSAIQELIKYSNYLKALSKLGELELLLNDSSLNINHKDGRLYLTLGQTYKTFKKYDKALIYYTKSIETSHNAKTLSLITRYRFRGDIHLITGDTLAAINDFKKVFEIPLESDSNLFELKERNYIKGLYHYYSNDYDKAYSVFQQVLQYNKTHNLNDLLSYPCLFMARIAIQNNNLNLGLSHSEEGLIYTNNDINLEHRTEFFENLYSINKQMGNPKKALKYFELYTALKDQLFNEEKTKAIVIQEAENNFALERQETNFRHKVELDTREQRQKNIIRSIIIVLGFVILWFLLVINRRKRKSAQREKILQEEFTQQLLKNTEDERSRIAGDLHDSVNHELLHLKEITNAGKKISSDDLSKIIEQVRKISYNLSPAMFEQVGLIKSVEEMCRKIMSVSSLLISTQFIYKENLGIKQELQIYRIIEEALNNILKHSQATHAFIKIESTSSNMEVKIKDNGVGFKTETLEKENTSFGLNNIKQRSKVIKGIVNIKSNEKGTELNLKLNN